MTQVIANKATETSASLALEEFSIPEQRQGDWLATALLFGLGMLWHLPQLSFVQMNPDEGVVLQGAAHVLRGALPYRDFFSFYTPGSYYWTAALFRVFGESILVARGSLLIGAGLAAVLTYLLARRLSARGPAILASVALTLIWPYRFLVLHNWDSTILALGAIYCLAWTLQSPKWFWALAAGAFSGLTLLTEQSKGAGLLLGIGLGTLALSRVGGSRLRRRQWLMMVAGLAAPILLTIAYFAGQHSLGAMLRDCWWPIAHYSTANRLPYGASMFLSEAAADWGAGSGMIYWGILLAIDIAAILIPAIPLVIVMLAAIRFAGTTAGSPSAGDRYLIFFGGITAGLLLAMLGTGRPDLHHVVYSAPLFWFLLPEALRGWGKHALPRAFAKVAVALGLVGFLALSAASEWPALAAKQPVRTRRGTVRMQVADEAIPYVQRRLPEGSKLLVHPYQPLYSFLTGTQGPTPYDYLQPGMHTREQFAEAARRVAANPPAGVLLDLSFLSRVEANWPNTPAAALAYDPVTDYILAHYQPCKVLNAGIQGGWRMAWMTRNGMPCP